MRVLLCVFLILRIFVFWFLFRHIGWGFGIIILLSLSWLFDWARNGRGSMDYLRRKAGFFSENKIEWQNEKLLEPHIGRRVIFLAVPNFTGFPLFWSFGWHGNKTLAKMDILYTLPAILLWIPFLRELLLASGAVEDDDANVLRLMKKEGRAVCYSPGKMRDILRNQSYDRIKIKSPRKDFISSLISKKVVIVPVVFLNELKRYPPLLKLHDEEMYFGKNMWYGYLLVAVKMLQKKSLDILGYPFPLLFGWNRKEKIMTTIGAPIDTKQYTVEQVDVVCRTIETGWTSLGNIFDDALLIED